MPLYEYRCAACDNVFEYMQGLSERPKRKCESCGGRLEKLVSRAGFVLKGTGWYETDFKGKKSPSPSSSAAAADSGAADSGAADSGAADSGASEVKPKKKAKKTASGSGD